MKISTMIGLSLVILSTGLGAACHKFQYQDYGRGRTSEYKIMTTPADSNGMVKFVEYFQGQKAVNYHRIQDLRGYQDAVNNDVTCVYHFQGTTQYLPFNRSYLRVCQMSSYFFLLDRLFTLLSPAQRDMNQEVLVSRANVFNGIAKLEWRDSTTGSARILTYLGFCQ